MQIPEPKNILIVRLSAIGDIVMASGLISSLRQRYPEARISWLSEPVGANLLSCHSDLEEVLIWPKNDWKHLLKQRRLLTLISRVSSYRQYLRGKEFDLAIDAQGLLKSALLCWMTGAVRKVGLNNKEGSQFFVTEKVTSEYNPIISSEYRYLAKYLVGDEANFHLAVEADNKVTASINVLLKQKLGDTPYVVFCPFTTRPQKHWPKEHWLMLTKLISDEIRLPIVVLGGPQDSEHAKQLEMESDNICALAGKTSLLQSSEIIRHASALIGVDTGMTHIGTAHDVPTVAIFGSTLPYIDTGAASSIVLSLKLACSPCRRSPTCGGQFPCMSKISPDMVFEQLQDVMR